MNGLIAALMDERATKTIKRENVFIIERCQVLTLLFIPSKKSSTTLESV